MSMHHDASNYVPNANSLLKPTPASVNALADTVTVANFIFDADGDFETQVDSVYVEPGGTVTWIISGFGSHTVTSGTGSADPQAGAIFDSPISTGAPQVSFTFPDPAIIPYFCVIHENFEMKGVVVVRSLVGVPPGGSGGRFLGQPVPNPTSGEVRFGLRLLNAGRVRADVYDLAGRLVARVLDENRAAGDQSILWNSRGSLRPGTYYLRVKAPGFEGKQAVTIVR